MDIGAMRLPEPTKRTSTKPASYLRGPITWDWLHTAMKLPGATIEVGLALWHFRALNKSLTFRKGVGDLARFRELSPDTVRRALHALENADLIKVTRTPGQKSVIEMLDSLVIPAGIPQITRDKGAAGSRGAHKSNPDTEAGLHTHGAGPRESPTEYAEKRNNSMTTRISLNDEITHEDRQSPAVGDRQPRMRECGNWS